MPSSEKKQIYDKKICGLLATFEKAFLVHADNVGSKQFQEIRIALRPDSVVLMGKNTMMKRSIRAYMEETGDTKWESLLEHLVGNVGLIFTKGDLIETRDVIVANTVPAPARVGALAPCDVSVPAGSTGMDPSQTAFFQILNIATKINKGTVEIVSDVLVVKKGDKVGSSEATLLAKLKICPFEYGLVVVNVFDNGSIYAPKVLDITDADLEQAFAFGVQKVAAVSLACNYPTLAAVPHMVINSYKTVLAVAVATGYTFPLAEKVKEALASLET